MHATVSSGVASGPTVQEPSQSSRDQQFSDRVHPLCPEAPPASPALIPSGGIWILKRESEPFQTKHTIRLSSYEENAKADMQAQLEAPLTKR